MLFTACWLRPSIPQAGKSNYSFSCFWHADWPAQVVASNPRILLAGWRFQHLFKTIKVRQLPVLPSVGSLVRLRQFQNVKLPLGYGGESPFHQFCQFLFVKAVGTVTAIIARSIFIWQGCRYRHSHHQFTNQIIYIPHHWQAADFAY